MRERNPGGRSNLVHDHHSVDPRTQDLISFVCLPCHSIPNRTRHITKHDPSKALQEVGAGGITMHRMSTLLKFLQVQLRVFTPPIVCILNKINEARRTG